MPYKTDRGTGSSKTIVKFHTYDFTFKMILRSRNIICEAPYLQISFVCEKNKRGFWPSV